jgi:hypothetical protein
MLTLLLQRLTREQMLFIAALFEVESKSFSILYSDSSREISDQYRFTSWQATGKNDARSSAHCGLRRVSPIAPSFAANLANAAPLAALRTLTLS